MLRRSLAPRSSAHAPAQARDIYYPGWLAGEWNTRSATVSVEAPAGVALFGGNASLARARAEVDGPPLEYRARWVAVAPCGGGVGAVAPGGGALDPLAAADMGDAAAAACTADRAAGGGGTTVADRGYNVAQARSLRP